MTHKLMNSWGRREYATLTDAKTTDLKHRRIESVDLLRGLAMIIMALDHVRVFFSHDALVFSPLDLTTTSPALFITRWVTHFCAPIFFFLAGASAFLSYNQGKTQKQLSRFLLTRGLWLVFLEETFILGLGWRFGFNYHYLTGYVIWALGWSMVALSVLIYLPTWAVSAFGVAMILGHNLLDSIDGDSFGKFFKGALFVLHEPNIFHLTPSITLDISYPLIPWIGVMAAGLGLGRILLMERKRRRETLSFLGIGLTLAFIILRFVNIDGDPTPWSYQGNLLFTLFSFINCEKYPPSLLFLLMTLGPSIMALALFDWEQGSSVQPIITFGRVPLFYYLLHLPVIHGLAIILAYIKYGQASWLFKGPADWPGASVYPTDYGYGLTVVYVIWCSVILVLYPACLWFLRLKQKYPSTLLSYL